MRRMLLVAVGTVVLAGCGKSGLFSAHADLVAEAAGQELKPERVAEILTSSKAASLNPTAAEFVTNLWVTLTLFSQAVADNSLKADSATVVESMWPAIAELKATRYHDTIMVHRANVSAVAIDSAIKADKARVVQHILITVDSSASAAKKAEARQKVADLLAQVHAGKSFSVLATQNTMDLASAPDSGFMLPADKGRYVAAFDKVVWQLKPGEVSGVVQTEYGFHIIRRASDAEAARFWKPLLAQRSMPHVDSVYFAELSKTNNVKVSSDAVARMRAAIADMDGKRNDKGTIASYKGGSFTVADFVRWTSAATSDPLRGPQVMAQVKSAPDSSFRDFAEKLTLNMLLLKDAEANHIGLTPGEWKAMVDSFTTSVDTLKAAIGLNTIDAKASTSERSKAAAMKVDQYFTQIITGAQMLHFPPGMLPWYLRGHQKYRIYSMGVARALQLGQAKLGRDSVPAAPVAPMNPARGGPPVAGGDTGLTGKGTKAGQKAAPPGGTKKP